MRRGLQVKTEYRFLHAMPVTHGGYLTSGLTQGQGTHIFVIT
jgi:hypothetical protein